MLVFKTQQEAAKYAQAQTPAKLVSFLTKLDKVYVDTGVGLIPDSHYDIVREVAIARQSESKLISDYLKKVGHKPTRQFVQLPYRMASLDKMKPGDGSVAKFAQDCEEFVLIDKEDGISALTDYENKQLPNIYTRGTDDEGQIINRIRPHLDIPQTVSYKKLPVRGEILMPLAEFNSKYADKFENPRNMVIGLTGRLKGDNSAAKDLHFLAYEIKNSGLKPSEQLALLKKLGFKVPTYIVVKKINDKLLTEYLAKRRKESHYEIDGIVVHKNIVSKEQSSGNPKNSKAFKVNTTDEMVEAIVLGVTWEVSQYNRVNPQINIEPIRVKGVTISNVTGHNAFFITHGYKYADASKYSGIKDMPVGKGAVILLTRSGDVIPKVEKVLVAAKKPEMPTFPYEWDEKGVFIFASDKSNALQVRIKQLPSFFSTIGVEGLKEATVTTIVESGYTTIPKVINMTIDDFLSLPRTQERTATKLYTNIRTALDEAPVEVLADACGAFGAGFGTRRAKVIFDAYPDILKLEPSKALPKVLTLSGFSDKTAEQFTNGMVKFSDFLKRIGYVAKPKKVVALTGSKMKGQAVCFTGVRSDVAEKFIVQNGGTIASGVNSKTTILVVKDLGSTSSKTVKAKALGIQIMTLIQFQSKYM